MYDLFSFNIVFNISIFYVLVGFILIAAMIQGDSFTILCTNSKLLFNDLNIYLIEDDRFEDNTISSSLFIFGPDIKNQTFCDLNMYLVIKGIHTSGLFVWPNIAYIIILFCWRLVLGFVWVFNVWFNQYVLRFILKFLNQFKTSAT